jgi:hypothetical protein
MQFPPDRSNHVQVFIGVVCLTCIASGEDIAVRVRTDWGRMRASDLNWISRGTWGCSQDPQQQVYNPSSNAAESWPSG